MRCEGCGASVFEGDAACTECGRELPATQPHVPVRPEPAPEPQLVTEPQPPELPAEAAKCTEHPDRGAAGTCARCGRFACTLCLPEPRRGAICPACEERLRREANPKELKRVRRELKVSFFFAAAVAVLLGVVMPVAMARGPLLGGPLPWLMLGGAATALLLLSAVGFLAREAEGLGWLAVLVEATGAAAFTTVIGGNCITFALLAFPIITVLRLLKWRSLRAEAERLGSPG